MTAESPVRESPSVRAGFIAIVLFGGVGFIAAAAVALYAFYLSRTPGVQLQPPAQFPAPRLVTDSDGLRDPGIARQQADLERYRWIDPKRGVFQIPIERAMELVAARGAAAYDPAPAPPDRVKR